MKAIIDNKIQEIKILREYNGYSQEKQYEVKIINKNCNCIIAEQQIINEEVTKEVKDMREVKKEIDSFIEHVDEYELLVQIFTSYEGLGGNNMYTDVNVDIYNNENDEFNSITVYTIKNKEPKETKVFWELQELHEALLEPYKKKVLKYLIDKYNNVISVANDNQ